MVESPGRGGDGIARAANGHYHAVPDPSVGIRAPASVVLRLCGIGDQEKPRILFANYPIGKLWVKYAAILTLLGCN